MKNCISPNPNSKLRSKTKSSKENVPPLSSPSVATAKILSSVAKMKTPFPVPPRPPSSKSSNPLKRKVLMECVHENSVPESPSVTTAKPLSSVGKRKCPLPPPSSNSSCNSKGKVIMESVPRFLDTGVQVIVRIRPPNVDADDEIVVEKVSEESLSVLDQTFTFDYVADTSSSQKDVYQLIGAPFVENCLEGFNSSIFAYGQTASGKTYTMWGHSNALLEYNPSGAQHGLAPRVFEQLFSRMSEEEAKHADKQVKYRCRCSFLEIYNEQITDLLDPSQRNLMIREDVKAGVYVENLTEHGVCTMNDVRLLLIKGLANRRTGATNMNAESSRSHCLFTCTVESRYKGISEGLSSCKTSRINLVDLAGSEKQKLTGAAGERLKESGNINRSLSQLGCKNETVSTLRFAQRAKAIKNKATVNEVTQGDVKVLQEMIHQLKDELLRAKANPAAAGTNGGYTTSSKARRSLSILKMSLNYPLILPHVDDDDDVEMEIDEEAVEKLCTEVENHINEREVSESSQGKSFSSSDPITARVNKLMEEADVNMEVCSKEVEKVLAGAIRREMALEEFCAKQTAEISKLDLLVQQYKGERDVLVAEVQHLRSQLS
ncbi:hypothetical protein MKW92_039064 [Papaver armeniacum]|nr:hypothetical protein MKW92_039064 [Papaver armeniacum]